MGLSVNFYVRQAKASKNGTAPLEVAINVYGKRVFVALPYRLYPEDFRKKRQPKALTDYMASVRAKVNGILSEMMLHGEPLTARAVAEHLRNGCFRPYTVGDLFKDYLDIKKSESGRTIEPATYRKYELTRDLFYGIVDSGRCVEEITNSAVLRFKALVETSYGGGTATGYMKRLKSVVRFALDNGRLKVNPCQGLKAARYDKPIVYLKDWERRALSGARIENASLAKVRDFAVLQLSTGMAYADMAALTREDIQEKNGVYYIYKCRQKTKKAFYSVILDPQRFLGILDRYGGRAPVISNQKLNAYLKTLGDLLGIHTTMTTHTFRRTYAMMLLNSGIRIDTVAAAMGHDVKTCAKYYAKLQEDTVISEISAKISAC